MANIDSQISKIRSAERGEDVRDSIISALKDINNDVPVDMSTPERYTDNMPQASDLSVSFNPPKLINQIYIQQAGSGGKSTNLVEATFTDNGVYPEDDPDYDPDDERRYYKKVTVNVPQLANKVIDLEEEITQNGTYSAPADWGADGLRSFTVNVNSAPVSGQFEVKFYDSDNTTLLETQLVPAYGSAEFHGTYPTSPLGPFTGWNPSPVNVTKDMKCYPKFGQIIIDPTEIIDGWDVICANRGVGYPLGSHKLLAFGATFTADEVKTWYPDYVGSSLALNLYMMMYKVAEGEGNSHSSWLSSSLPIYNSTVPGVFPGGRENSWAYQQDVGLRKFLNGAFYNHFDQIFKNAIVPVMKYSLDKNGIAVPTEDRIWIPGTSEIGTYQTAPDGSDRYDFTSSFEWVITVPYVNNINILDSSSKKYVRDYLNNDRNYPANCFMKDYQNNTRNYVLRDSYPSYYDGVYYCSSGTRGVIVYGCNTNPTGTIYNCIGFCL